jgi:hypothetical protein
MPITTITIPALLMSCLFWFFPPSPKIAPAPLPFGEAGPLAGRVELFSRNYPFFSFFPAWGSAIRTLNHTQNRICRQKVQDLHIVKKNQHTMKKNILVSALCLGLVGGTFAQTTNNPNTNTNTDKPNDKVNTNVNAPDKDSKTENTAFMDRFYKIKDSYKDLPDTWGKFAASSYTMEEYMKRYFAYKDTHPTLSQYAADYAGSEYNMEEFTGRCEEIKKAYPDMAAVYGDYASSKWNIKDFITRYYQVKASYPKLKEYFGAYAASNQNTDEFAKRYFAIKDAYPKNEKYYGDYARTTMVLGKDQKNGVSSK